GEISVGISVQFRRASATVKQTYRGTRQNPPSWTCDTTSEPAPKAKTRSSRLRLGLALSKGAASPAAVMIDTVDDPVAIRTTAAISQPRMSGETDNTPTADSTALLTPPSISTRLNPPP